MQTDVVADDAKYKGLLRVVQSGRPTVVDSLVYCLLQDRVLDVPGWGPGRTPKEGLPRSCPLFLLSFNRKLRLAHFHMGIQPKWSEVWILCSRVPLFRCGTSVGACLVASTFSLCVGLGMATSLCHSDEVWFLAGVTGRIR